jgi:hypothetical protein
VALLHDLGEVWAQWAMCLSLNCGGPVGLMGAAALFCHSRGKDYWEEGEKGFRFSSLM